MKKLFGVFILASVLLTLGFVSAAPICATYETTFVSGNVTDATNGNSPVAGADVKVTCNEIYTKTATTDSNGGYVVQFTAEECKADDDVKVTATYSTLTGENESVAWETQNNQIGCLELIVNVACGNVPLVPEFGTIVGIVTALGALGVFFVVRRK